MAVTKNLFDVSGKVALVTGGRRGLGKAMVMGLANAGADVAVVAKHSDAADVQRAVESLGRRFHYIAADLLDGTQRTGLVARVAEHFGRLDILVNNAGAQRKQPAMDYSLKSWGDDIELMLTAVLDLSQQGAKTMAAGGGGKIIHVASISSFQGARQIIGYAAAKHGLVGLTKCMANEWAALGINVNAIAPGIFETDMASDVLKDSVKSAELRGRVPAGRFGQPEDIVGPLLFLASNASRHVHGHVLLVDGGWMGR
jgi:2-dehydro-3-deoxy-D-gluconate 5-dehydrogenase